jgi:hypothetical protein
MCSSPTSSNDSPTPDNPLIWKPVPGFPYYLVSENGILITIPRQLSKHKTQIVCPHIGVDGGFYYRLWSHNKRTLFSAQSLVARAFLKPFDVLSRLEAQIIDESKPLHADNLRYVYLQNPRRRRRIREGWAQLRARRRSAGWKLPSKRQKQAPHAPPIDNLGHGH